VPNVFLGYFAGFFAAFFLAFVEHAAGLAVFFGRMLMAMIVANFLSMSSLAAC